MSKLYDQLQKDLMAARREPNVLVRSLLSTLTGEINLLTKKKDYKGDLEGTCLSTIKTFVINCNISLQARHSDQIESERDWLSQYLPVIMPTDQLTTIITQFVSDNNLTDKRTAIKPTMAHLTEQYPNVIDNKIAIAVINSLF